MSKTDSWVGFRGWMPFRTYYFYWDKEPYLNFKNKKVKIKTKIIFSHKETSYTGFLISCWNKDSKKVEKILNNVDLILRTFDKNYIDFLKMWHQNSLKFSRRGVPLMFS